MVNKRIVIKPVQLHGDILERLLAALAPATEKYAADLISELESGRRDVPYGMDKLKRVSDLQLLLGVQQWSWTITDENGVEHTSPRTGPSTTPPSAEVFEGSTSASFSVRVEGTPFDPTAQHGLSFSGYAARGHAEVTVTAPLQEIEALSEAYREIFEDYVLPEPAIELPPFKVFIAYGGSDQWEIVRDYLKRADIEVDAFTEVERAGEVTIDVVSKMIRYASMAVIVMTVAMEHGGVGYARQNVVHEAGFAQGVIGVRNTIILVEDGVDVPSNLASVTHIKFPRGSIHKTEQSVLSRVRETMADRDRA